LLNVIRGITDTTIISLVADRFFQYCRRRLKLRRVKDVVPVLGEPFVPPGVRSATFNSFVSSKNNSFGLKADFFHDKKSGVSCRWLASKAFEGYPQTLHGGIGFALLDELLAYAIYQRYQTYAVTLASKTKWKGKVAIGSMVSANAVVVSKCWRFVKVKGQLFNERGRVVMEVSGTFYIPTKSEFKKLIDLSVMPPETLPFCGLD